MTTVLGADLSLNHGAFVWLLDGKLLGFRYYTGLAGSAKAGEQIGASTRTPKRGKEEDKQTWALRRLAWLGQHIDEVLDDQTPDYAGIEDYAVGASQGAHQTGELGGLARLLFWEKKIPLRLHEPNSVKMFAAHNGAATKDMIESSVLSRWGGDFGKFNPPPPKPTAKRPNPEQNRQTSEDIADAYAVAQLVWTEYRLRQGDIGLGHLHPKELQVFNRCTKAYPTSLLGRDWIRR